MKITSITLGQRDRNRANIFIDGVYRFSLDISQIVDLGVKVGREYEESELADLEQESSFGKVYSRALEYCLTRPRSVREMKDYLYRKTQPKRDKKGILRPGVSSDISTRVLNRLMERGYIDDCKFANHWVENRCMTKGSSRRKLINELRNKGVSEVIIEQVMSKTDRSDESELRKIVSKKRARYPDDQKFITYLARLGFDYDDIKSVLSEVE
jgi:regulatory protein